MKLFTRRPTHTIDRDELKVVIMSCGPDPAPAEVADVVCAWLGDDRG